MVAASKVSACHISSWLMAVLGRKLVSIRAAVERSLPDQSLLDLQEVEQQPAHAAVQVGCRVAHDVLTESGPPDRQVISFV